MIMSEECRLRLFGNSVSVRLGGGCGRRGGGGIALDSTEGPVVPVDRDRAAAAHGGVMQRCLDMSKNTDDVGGRSNPESSLVPAAPEHSDPRSRC